MLARWNPSAASSTTSLLSKARWRRCIPSAPNRSRRNIAVQCQGGSGGVAGLGALLASLKYLAMSAIFPGDLSDVWGWRCRFLTGIVSSILGLVVFSSLEESPLSTKLGRREGRRGRNAELRHIG